MMPVNRSRDQSLPTTRVGNTPADSDHPSSYLKQEYERWSQLFAAQPPLVQRFLEGQARQLANALVENLPRFHFVLPDRVVTEAGTVEIPAAQREHRAGSQWERLKRSPHGVVLRLRLDTLESSEQPGVAAACGLLRFSTARYMVNEMLPAGRLVVYASHENEEIASIPVARLDERGGELGSAITASQDAIAEEGENERREGDRENTGRGDLQVPFMPYARRFYLPQWVAFDEAGELIVGNLAEAEAHLASMQEFLHALHSAVGLAPYMVADENYQRKRYGMLGQIVNQGRALARYQIRKIIALIQQRAGEGNLNRGLSLYLPYFDDQALEIKTYPFQIIPAGRIMFVPSFVVRAARQEHVKVAQDTRLSPSTRNHLMQGLQQLEIAFLNEAMSGDVLAGGTFPGEPFTGAHAAPNSK